jgi:nitroreductase
MDIVEAIKNRKTIRAFKPTPVSKTVIKNVLELTVKSPSAINLQPWQFYVVMDEERQRVSRALLKAYKEKNISCSPDTTKPLPRVYNRRGVMTAESMNPFLERMNVEFNEFINEGSCNFYGAPVAVFICIDKVFRKSRLVDMGIALGYFVLAAHSQGLGTCPIGLVSAYKDEIKEVVNIPENEDLVISVALGYPDLESPINEYKSPRDSLEQFITWID